jgi:hypothetical protein
VSRRDDDPRNLIDVTPLVPEAQEIVWKAADVYIRHTSPWLIGLLVLVFGAK